ncbi:MAG: DUF6125 family protein [Planctomycetota bacterium]|jgi:hypothetical protein
MNAQSEAAETGPLSRKDTARLVIDFFHRTAMHYAMWFAEVRHQLGREKAWDILKTAFERSYAIQMKRLSETLGFEMDGDIPKPLLALPDDTLNALKENAAKNWLANDGVWFQAVEFSRGMFDAKRSNDSCWAQFSPFEAWCIKRFLNLPERSGLEGLKKALLLRLYATINKQSITEETPTSFVFQMNDCRVQTARKRKGLEDYPCKSGGMAEYPTFAETIDPGIKTECVGCPPDEHPDEWFCAWRFSIAEA